MHGLWWVGLPRLQGHRLAGGGRLRYGASQCAPQRGLRSRAVAGLRVLPGYRPNCYAAVRYPGYPSLPGDRFALSGRILSGAGAMRVPISWLREFVDFEKPVDDLCAVL